MCLYVSFYGVYFLTIFLVFDQKISETLYCVSILSYKCKAFVRRYFIILSMLLRSYTILIKINCYISIELSPEFNHTQMQCIEMKASNLSARRKKMTICILTPHCTIIYSLSVWFFNHTNLQVLENCLHFASLTLQNELVKFKWKFLWYEYVVGFSFYTLYPIQTNIYQNERNYSRAHTRKKQKNNWEQIENGHRILILKRVINILKMCQINHLQTFCGLLLLTQ